MSSNLPYQCELGDARSILYVSPEDVYGSISGGSFEALADCWILSSLGIEVHLVCPIRNEDLKPSQLANDILDRNNIKLWRVPREGSSWRGLLYFSVNRASVSHFLALANRLKVTDPNFSCVIGCHRNLGIQIQARKHFGSDEIFFKSYGSIWRHNLDNIIACFQVRKVVPFKILSSFLYFIFFEKFSFLLTKKSFSTRRKESLVYFFDAKIRNFLFGKKIVYGCSGPYYYLKDLYPLSDFKSNIIRNEKDLVSFDGDKIVLGAFGDNRFPTAGAGWVQILTKIEEMDFFRKKMIVIKIAGHYDGSVERILQKFCSRSNIKLSYEFKGFIPHLDEFLNTLDVLCIPVSGGSAMPIKALEGIAKFKGKIFATDYVLKACSGYIDDQK